MHCAALRVAAVPSQAQLRARPLFQRLDWGALNTPGGPVPYRPRPADPAAVCLGRVHRSEAAPPQRTGVNAQRWEGALTFCTPEVEAIQAPYRDDGSGWDRDF